ncbi:GAF domain-containing sensor histidine kinase [Maritimibacter alkaliphilus]|uniref:GAF domain-containing sensor histidine kinase n=1 Tax=Maritimibacter alkaliphilus TaxID=404236 RepID=UPI001C96240B|nr:GAF domain-containing sensor histidine kinase [Maritimibacter alkaliphilus]MBY6089774.1 GAF domain-containing sensor histidine kinase [Maritimibacter alkaliphilus]
MLSDNDSFSQDVRLVGLISDLSPILEACANATDMGFVAVARVTEDRWVTCASLDRVNFGLRPGDELEVGSTICREVRACGSMIVIPDVDASDVWRDHHTPRQYGFKSYISVPIIRADGRFWGTLCAIDPMSHEITTQAKDLFTLFARLIARELDRQEELEAGRANLESERDTSRLREEFIAIVGHDLRNPIAAVTSGLRMMSERDLSPERTAMLIPEMQRALTRASQIITNLMDFARGRLGAGIELNAPTPVDLAPVFQDVVGEIRQVAPQAVECRIHLPRPLTADPQRLGQLLSNLLGNAVTYGDPSHPIEIDIAEREGELHVGVTNQGEPIPDHVKASLFQPFSRQEGQSSLQGLGLGLYIASEIARAHGGLIDVLSTPQGSTTFRMRIPAKA